MIGWCSVTGRKCSEGCTCGRHRKQNICSVEGCNRVAQVRGWCRGHYQRWSLNGDPGIAELSHLRPRPKITKLPCRVDECVNLADAKGWCGLHYRRWKKYGDPHTVLKRPVGPAHHSWLDRPSYATLHQRLRNRLGPASQHQCVDCGKSAAHWSYDGLDPTELTETVLVKNHSYSVAYSVSENYYQPRCPRCHQAFDQIKKEIRQILWVAKKYLVSREASKGNQRYD